jgi:hypothetical protein
MERLTGLVKDMTAWVEANGETIRRYVDNAIRSLEAFGRVFQRALDLVDPAGRYNREQQALIRSTKTEAALMAERARYRDEILQKEQERKEALARAEQGWALAGGKIGEAVARRRAMDLEAEIRARQHLIKVIDEQIEAMARTGGPVTPGVRVTPAGGGEGGGAGAAVVPAGPQGMEDIWREHAAAMIYLTEQENAAATQAERMEAVQDRLNTRMTVGAKNALVLASAYDQAKDASARTEAQMEVMGQVGQAAGEVVAGALGAGIGEMAKWKAKQNAIMAAEQTAMGIVALLNPLTVAKAGGHFAAAGKFAAIAAAWGGLSALTGGGGGAGGAAAASRDVGGAAAARSESPGAEVHIYFDGPGFDAVNPRVQRVVAGAVAAYGERYGPNAKVTTHRRRSG